MDTTIKHKEVKIGPVMVIVRSWAVSEAFSLNFGIVVDDMGYLSTAIAVFRRMYSLDVYIGG